MDSVFEQEAKKLIFRNKVLNIIMYILIALAVIFVMWLEVVYQFCPQGPSIKTCVPNQYNSAVLSGTIATATDSFDTIISKTIQAASGDLHTIKWSNLLL